MENKELFNKINIEIENLKKQQEQISEKIFYMQMFLTIDEVFNNNDIEDDNM